MIECCGGFFYSATTKRWLFLQRATSVPDTWGLVGGKIEPNEEIRDALDREIREEIGFIPPVIEIVPLEKFVSDDQRFVYHTFACAVNYEFIPDLNHEHKGYCWTDINTYPKPLHPGLFKTLKIQVIQEKIKSLMDSLSQA